MICYIFRPESGRARILTDDKQGTKLPKRRTGTWVYDGQLDIRAGEDTSIGASSNEIITNIQRDGYFLWLEPEMPMSLPEQRR